MRHTTPALLLALLAPALSAQKTETNEPLPKVLLIGIDGLRPDALAAASTPHLDALAAGGLHFDAGQAVSPTDSGPNWTSMLTGVESSKHGVVDDTWAGAQFGQYPTVYTRLESAAPWLRTEMITAWGPLADFLGRGADLVIRSASDAASAALAAQRAMFEQPDFLFLHLRDVDSVGHASGFDLLNPAYMAAIQQADAQVGLVMRGLEVHLAAEPALAEDWLVIVSTDHGGLGSGHGGTSPEETTIFVTLNGGGTPVGAELPSFRPYDVTPTVLDHMGVEMFVWWGLDGTPLVQHFQCAQDLVAIPRHAAGNVDLSWTPATGTQVTGSLLYRNGVPVAFVAPGAGQYVDRPDLSAMSGHATFAYELYPLLDSPGAPCPTLTAEAVLSTGTVFLEDDFDAYASDAEFLAAGWLPTDVGNPLESSTWTVEAQPVCPGYMPTDRTNPPTYDGSPSRGAFAISDSCKGGLPYPNPPGSGMSHDLITPRFDCTGEASVWLHADVGAVLNNAGDAVFKIDASRDDGQTWFTRFTRISPGRYLPPLPNNNNADGYFGRLSVDLSHLLAGWPQCRVRFRHFEPNWDWWVAIDNVIVDTEDTTQGGSTALLATETFSGVLFPPAGWSLVGLNTGTETWHHTDKGGIFVPGAVSGAGVNRIGHPGPLPDFALLDSNTDPDPLEDEYLITPAVDCSGSSRVFLHWKSEVRRFSPAQHEAVLVSLDGGQTFLDEPLFTYDTNALHAKNDPGYWQYAEDPWYAERVLEVPAAAGLANVAFAFHFQSDGNESWWAVDDVAITAEP